MTMKLYNANFSPNALRVRAVVNELGLELEVIDVDIRAGENKTDAYLAINPNAKVPALVDGDFVLWESRAINNYLAALHPEHGLYPENPKLRATIDQWSYWQSIHLGPAMQKVTFEKFMKQKLGMGELNQSVVDTEMKNVDQFLGVLDAQLVDQDWVTEQLSVADFALASTFVARNPGGISLDDVPNVANWIGRIEGRKSWQRATAPIIALMSS